MDTMDKPSPNNGGDICPSSIPHSGGNTKARNEAGTETFELATGAAAESSGEEENAAPKNSRDERDHATEVCEAETTPEVPMEATLTPALQPGLMQNTSFASEFPVTTIRDSGRGDTENYQDNTKKNPHLETQPASVPGAVAVSSSPSDRTAEVNAPFASELPATTAGTFRTMPSNETENKSKYASTRLGVVADPFVSAESSVDRDYAEEEEKTQEAESEQYDENVAPSPLTRHPNVIPRHGRHQSSPDDTKNQRSFPVVEHIQGPNLPPSEEREEGRDHDSRHSTSVESTMEGMVLPAEIVQRKRNAVEAQNVATIEDDESKPSSFFCRWWVLPGMLLLLIIIVVVVAVLVFGNNGDSPMLTRAPSQTLSPTLSPQSLLEMLESLTLSISGDAIYEDGTSQNKAFTWMTQTELSSIDTEYKLVELYALTVLYFSTNGPSWLSDFDLRFLSSSYACEWNAFGRGARCVNSYSTVDEISLDSMGLQGPLPDELSALTALQIIEMNGNSLIGAIPPSFGNLTMLETLDLSGNSLTGTIPTTIGALPSLKHFDASSNFLEGGIPSFASQQLPEIRLYNNRLNGSLDEFFKSTGLAELKLIDFVNNQLTGSMPASIGNFAQLEEIWLYNNDLTGTIPTEFGRLTNIEWLDLADNDLSGTVPNELGNCLRLEELAVQRCGLDGSFPSSVAHLPELYSLYIHGNNFTNDYNETFCTRKDQIGILYASCLEDTVLCPCCDSCCTPAGFSCDRGWV